MTKDMFIETVLDFIEYYKRLPTLPEDDIILKEDDGKERVLRASVRISKFFKTKEKFVEYLFENNIISADMISEISGQPPATINNVLRDSNKNPNIEARRAVEMFLGYDVLEGKHSINHPKCDGCTKECKQLYWVELFCGASNGYVKK